VFGKKHVSLKSDIVRYKARFVVKGYAQRESIDYSEVFSLVVNHSSIRILLALVTQYGLELDQLDMKIAFLYGYFEEEIYMSSQLGSKLYERRIWMQTEEITL